jgi:surface carbohydrate biosynthesis protein
MPRMTRTVYIPIEESNRELSAKLLIAGELLKHRVTVLLGRQPMVVGNLPHMPPGVVLFKGTNAMPAYLMRRAAELGHLSVATDEEGLGRANETIMARDMDPTIGPVIALLFAQGQRHAEAMDKNIPGVTDKIRVVGNARLDILREPFREEFVAEADQHRVEHGEYVLVDSNLGAINSRWGGTDQFLEVLVRVGWLDREKPEDMEYFDRRIRTEQANAVIMRRTLERLAENFPNLTFIVRPHPAEREEPWIKAYENSDNIRVTAVGGHVPWLLGARLMLHTGCTTGLEAEVLGVPSISLLPVGHEELSCGDLLSNLANECAVGMENAVDMASTRLRGDLSGFIDGRAHRMRAIADHVTGLEGPFAHQRIANEIVELLSTEEDANNGNSWEPTNRDRFIKTQEDYEVRVPGLRGADYSWSKVQIVKASLEKKFEALNQAMSTSSHPDISEVAEGVFCFSPPL